MDPGLFFGGGGGGDCRIAAAFGKGPEKTLANYKACSRDTRQEVLKELENHFRLNEEEGSR